MAKKATAAKKAEETVKQETINQETVETPVQEKKPAQGGYTEAQVQEMIAKAVAQALAQNAHTAPDAPAQGQMVTLRFVGEVNDRNVIPLGPDGKYGQIIGKRWMGQVDKMSFKGDFRTPLVQALLKKRNLIVMDGLTEDERRIYGVQYAEGEVIDEKLYDRMTRMSEGDLLPIYMGLCPEWRRMLAVKFADAYDRGELKVTRDTLLALNRISRKDNSGLPKDDIRRKGAFWQLIQKLNYAEDADLDD